MTTRNNINDRLNAAASSAAKTALEEHRSRIISRTRVGLDADYKPMDPLIDPKASGSRPLVAGMEFFGQARVSATEEGAGAILEVEGQDAVILRGQEKWGRTLFTLTDRDRDELVTDFKKAMIDELRRK